MRDLKPYVGRRVLLFTSFGATFDGTLDRVSADGVVLDRASIMADDGGASPVDGQAVIPLVSIDWVQIP